MIYVVNFNQPAPDNEVVVNTTSRSNNWSRSLSPFFLGPVDLYDNYKSQNVENAWQYSKVYEYYADNGEPGERYFNWAKEGWNTVKANRYPMGREAKPLYSYWNGEKLTYTQARRRIYIPLYSSAVKKTNAFGKLQELFHNSENIYLQDFDAHNLVPTSYEYWDLVDNPNIKVGHAYVLAMMLEGYL